MRCILTTQKPAAARAPQARLRRHASVIGVP
jgi:hypothetical protein